MQEHIAEEDLVLRYYGEHPSGAEVEDHLAQCAECRARMQGIQLVLNASAAVPVPERGAAYESAVWEKLQPRLAPSRKGWWMKWRLWMPVPVLAALVVLAFLAGRYLPHPAGRGSDVAQIPKVREKVLFTALGDHLQRSQIMLAEIANAEPRKPVNIAMEREVAEILLNANRLYRQSAELTGNDAMAAVLDDLERILIEIAHSPAELSTQQMQALQGRIDAQALRFKIRILGQQAEERAVESSNSRQATL